MTMEDESNNKTQLKLPKIFTLAGFALIALAIFSFFMSVLCGLGGSGSCDGDSATYFLYGIFGVLAIAIAQVLNKDRSISLANIWLLLGFWFCWLYSSLIGLLSRPSMTYTPFRVAPPPLLMHTPVWVGRLMQSQIGTKGLF